MPDTSGNFADSLFAIRWILPLNSSACLVEPFFRWSNAFACTKFPKFLTFRHC